MRALVISSLLTLAVVIPGMACLIAVPSIAVSPFLGGN